MSRCVSRWLVCGLLGLALRAGAAAEDRTRQVSQYRRSMWQAEQGLAAGNIQSIAQTPDGYLWIATKTNLLRFDGLHFSPFLSSEKEPLRRVLSLSVDRGGTLWLRTQDARLMRVEGGSVTSVALPERQELGIVAMTPGQTEGLYVTNVNKDTVYLNGSTAHKIPVHSRSLLLSIAQGTDRKLWVGTTDYGLLVWDGVTTRAIMQAGVDRKINCLLPSRDGRMWIGTDDGFALWDGKQIVPQVLKGPEMQHLQVLTMLEDRANNLWLGTSHGLLRYNESGAEWLPGASGPDGPSVTALIEDREGDIWFGNGPVLERLQATALMPVPQTRGLRGGAVYVDGHGRAWLAGHDGGLSWSEGGEVHPVTVDGLDQDVTYSIDGEGDDIWIGRRDHGLTRLTMLGGRLEAKTWGTADGLSQNHVFAVRVEPGGAVWAGTLTGGLSRYFNGSFTTFGESDGLPSNTVTAIERDRSGRLWIGTPNGLCYFDGRRCNRLPVVDASPSNEVISLLADPEGGLLVGTTGGLMRVFEEKRKDFPFSSGPQRAVLGMAFDRDQTLWVATDRDVVSVSWKDLLAAGPPDRRVYYGPEDGLLSSEGVRRSRSVVATPSGAVLLAAAQGIIVTAFDEMPVSAALPHLEGIAADGTALDLKQVRVPPGTNRVSFSFTGLNLRTPERVRVRYRLDGLDTSWMDARGDRQATYTNLAPGKYRFRLSAASAVNLWNPEESVTELTVMPLYWQRIEIRMAVAVFVVLCLALMYLARMRQLLARAHLLTEERLRERTRIARELHDTLLQGFISCLMHLHVVTEEMPAGSPVRGKLSPILDVMEAVIEEARLAVLELRTPGTGELDLQAGVGDLLVPLRHGAKMQFVLSSSGTARSIAPAAFEELCRIVQEAVRNALRHSGADRVQIRIFYGRFRLGVQVEDNGCGMDAETLEHGRERHWGLKGMKERAQRIGARVRITSVVGKGTEVYVRVPAASAYVRSRDLHKTSPSSPDDTDRDQ